MTTVPLESLIPRRERVDRMCLLAALMRLSDEIDEICDVHTSAITSVPAEMSQLKSAVSGGIAALKREG